VHVAVADVLTIAEHFADGRAQPRRVGGRLCGRRH
jgi:hypothetical protein